MKNEQVKELYLQLWEAIKQELPHDFEAPFLELDDLESAAVSMAGIVGNEAVESAISQLDALKNENKPYPLFGLKDDEGSSILIVPESLKKRVIALGGLYLPEAFVERDEDHIKTMLAPKLIHEVMKYHFMMYIVTDELRTPLNPDPALAGVYDKMRGVIANIYAAKAVPDIPLRDIILSQLNVAAIENAKKAQPELSVDVVLDGLEKTYKYFWEIVKDENPLKTIGAYIGADHAVRNRSMDESIAVISMGVKELDKKEREIHRRKYNGNWEKIEPHRAMMRD